MKFSDRVNLEKKGKHWRLDEKGYLHIAGTAARSGVLKYPERGYNTYIPADVLKRDGKGLENVVIVSIDEKNDHGDANVHSKNTREKSRGWVKSGSTRFDGEYLHCEIVITDHKLIDLVMSEKLTALSCGYEVEWRYQPGEHKGERYDYIISKIIYNHLAVVDLGRAGPRAKLHTDRKTMSDLLKVLSMRAVESKDFSLPARTVTIMTDRADEGVMIENRDRALVERIQILDQKLKEANEKIEEMETQNKIEKEKHQQLTDAVEKMIPLSDVSTLASELVDVRETCQAFGIEISENPFSMKLAVCDRALPRSSEDFRSKYQESLKTGEITESMKDSLESLYNAAKEQQGFLKDKLMVDQSLAGINSVLPDFTQTSLSDQSPANNNPMRFIYQQYYH